MALESVACTGLRCGHPWLDSVRVHANGETCASQSPPPVIASDTVYLSDCITGMRRMTDESVDLIVSDPPYLINYATGHRQDKAHDFCTPIQNDSNPELIQKYVRRVLSHTEAKLQLLHVLILQKRMISSKQRSKCSFYGQKRDCLGEK